MYFYNAKSRIISSLIFFIILSIIIHISLSFSSCFAFNLILFSILTLIIFGRSELAIAAVLSALSGVLFLFLSAKLVNPSLIGSIDSIFSFVFFISLLFSIFQTKSFIESNRYNIDKEVNKSFNFIYLLLVGSSILFLFYLHDIKINDRYLSFLITGLSISIICTITCLEYALKWITGSKNSNPRCFIDLIYFTRPSTKKNLIRSYIYKSPVLEWYLRVKLKMENDYEPFIELCHSKKTITDIGCGYGFLSHMLYYTDKDRKITGIDYDEEKISTAKGVLKNESVQFISGDAEEVVFQNSDIFIINDVLHYMTFDKQERIIEKCMQSLNGGGKIIIREGNSESKKHAGTKFTEVWSTKILKFNKTENELYFTSRSRMEAIAKRHNYLVEVIDNTKFTSNEIFVFKKTNKTE